MKCLRRIWICSTGFCVKIPQVCLPQEKTHELKAHLGQNTEPRKANGGEATQKYMYIYIHNKTKWLDKTEHEE